MKNALLIAVLLAINASAAEWTAATVPAWDDAYAPFSTAKNMTNQSLIKWIATDEVGAVCDREQLRRGGKGFGFPVNACSFWDKTPTGYTCIVITKKNPTMHTIGHEVRHCFQDRWHQ